MEVAIGEYETDMDMLAEAAKNGGQIEDIHKKCDNNKIGMY